MLLFFSYFSTRARLAVVAITPCSIMTIGLSLSFGATARRYYQERIWLQVLNTSSTKKPACRVYLDRWGGTKRQANLPHLYNVVLTGTLAVLCCTLYRIHIKCGVLLEIFISSHQLAASCSDHRIRQLWTSNCEMLPQWCIENYTWLARSLKRLARMVRTAAIFSAVAGHDWLVWRARTWCTTLYREAVVQLSCMSRTSTHPLLPIQ